MLVVVLVVVVVVVDAKVGFLIDLLSRSLSSFWSSGCQTSCRYFTGHTPCRPSAERTIIIPFTSSFI
jgi:hypothetical protein